MLFEYLLNSNLRTFVVFLDQSIFTFAPPRPAGKSSAPHIPASNLIRGGFKCHIKRARWVDGVRYLGQSPKKGFFLTPSLIDRNNHCIQETILCVQGLISAANAFEKVTSPSSRHSSLTLTVFMTLLHSENTRNMVKAERTYSIGYTV